MSTEDCEMDLEVASRSTGSDTEVTSSSDEEEEEVVDNVSQSRRRSYTKDKKL